MLSKKTLEIEFAHGDAYCAKYSVKDFLPSGVVDENVTYIVGYRCLFEEALTRDELEQLRAAINEALNA